MGSLPLLKLYLCLWILIIHCQVQSSGVWTMDLLLKSVVGEMLTGIGVYVESSKHIFKNNESRQLFFLIFKLLGHGIGIRQFFFF